MKKNLRGLLRYTERVFTQPHSVRSAKMNLWGWGGATTIALANVGMNVLLWPSWAYLWLAVNLSIAALDGTMLWWSTIGLFWRKEQDARAAEKAATSEAFYALVMNEYKRP